MPPASITMVFTDLVASTEVKNHLPGNDITARNQYYRDHILVPHRHRVESTLESYRGRVIKTEGDGYFLVFEEVNQAALWAIALQISHVKTPIETPLGPLQVKIGIHTGAPLQDGSDYIGQEVDYAARLVGLAQGERTLLSEVSAVLLRNAHVQGMELYFQGEYTLRGLGRIPVYELVYRLGDFQVPQRGPLGYERALKAAAARRKRLTYIGLCTAVAVVVIGGLRLMGWLQPLELRVLDSLMRMRPPEAVDTRILVVRVTEADFQALGEYPLSDRTVLRVLEALAQHQPRLIGLDLYRDIPQGQGRDALLRFWQEQDGLYGVCRNADTGTLGIAPPETIPPDQIGFADVVIDGDQVLRRQLLVQTAPAPASACQAAYGLSTLLAMHYLSEAEVNIQVTEQGEIILGDRPIPRLTGHSGGYQRIDAGGYQMLLNYRFPLDAIPQVTLQAVLSQQVKPEDIRDRILLVGVDQEGTDRHFTPGSLAQRVDQSVPGVLVQAQMVSNLISGVLDGRPWLRSWPAWGDALWVTAWTFAGGWLLGMESPGVGRGWGLKLGGLVLCLSGASLGALILGIWVPIVPTAVAIMLAVGGVFALISRDLEHHESI